LNGEAIRARFASTGAVGLMLGILGIIGCAVLAFINTELFFRAYLYGWGVAACLTIGCFALLLLIHTVRASWGRPMIRMLEAGGGPKALIIVLLAFIPVLVSIWTGVGSPYPWTNDRLALVDPVVQHKTAWLNPLFFTIRVVGCFAAMIFYAYILKKWSVEEDETGNTNLQSRRTNWAAPGLVVMVISTTLLFTDVFMSLDAHWFSTIYSPWLLVSSGLMAFSLGLMFFASFCDREPYLSLVSPKLLKDLGNLLLALTLVWAYFTLSQFLIIWSGNLPEFITYYWVRSQDGWQALAAFVMLFGFFVPFFGLVSPRSKRVPRLLGMWATLVFVVRFFDLYLAISPATLPEALGGNLLFMGTQAVAVLAVGGLWLWVFGSGTARAKVLVPSYYKKVEAHHSVPLATGNRGAVDHG
jgi:hypothetical protein